MCGILANLDWTGNSSLEQVKNGLAVLRHRGPDESRLWRSPGGHVTLGHARLRVMDLATGAQPIRNETGHIHAIVNGEFYDWESIRTELEARGHRFTTCSDSEILVHLYEEFGAHCLPYLRGEYAFVLWDERAHVLFAARDRFGIKPLFFTEGAGMLLFASEAKALHAAGIPAAWDEQGFWEKLVLHSPLQGRTLFRHITELPPAHYLLAQNGTLISHCYWDFHYPRDHEIKSTHSDDEYAEQLLTVLDGAVRTRLRADVPVACYLSGGLDSSSILGLMTRYASRPVDAFCLTFDDPAYDESVFAQETADELQTHFIPVPITQATLAAHCEEAVWHGETLFTNAQCVAKFLLSRAVQNAGYRVVLTGEGADEIFGGYPVFLIDSVQHASPLFPSRAFLPIPAASASSAFLERLGYWPAWHQAQEAFLEPFRELLPSRFDSEAVRHCFLDGLELPRQLTGRSILNQSLYLYNKTVLPSHILTVMGDRMEMAHSVEARLPFLDHHVVEFSRALPSSQKIRGFAEKFILRKAMRLVIPPAVCGRRKQALQTPPFLQTAGPLRDLLEDTLRGRATQNIPFLDKRAVIRLLDRAFATDAATSATLESPLMALLTTCFLSQRFHLS